jgi:magnesium transporter
MLVNCVAYQKGQKHSDIPIEKISDFLLKPDCFVWVAIKDPSDQELFIMQKEFNLHELAVEDARKGHERPKLEEYEDSLFGVFHLMELQEGKLHVGEVDVFIGKNYILTVRHRSKQDFLGVRVRCEKEPKLLQLGSSFVLYALIDNIVDRYFPVIDALSVELEKIEENIFKQGSARENIEKLYQLKGKIMTMKHAVDPMLESVGHLHGSRVHSIFADSKHYFRDVDDHLNRINAMLNSIRETIHTAIQVNLSMVSIDESEVTKRLAAWAAIFGADTLLAGIWGMNFKHMPEIDWKFGYPFAIIVMTLMSLFLYRHFKKSKWL